MKTEILIENLKCHGCANTITKAFKNLPLVTDVVIDHEQNKVTITHDGGDEKEFKAKLAQIGYPEQGKNNKYAQVKSYVSCAIGRITPI